MQKLQQHIKTFFTMALAMVVLLSLSGLSLHSHYCSHGEVASHSLFIPVDECNMEAESQVTENCCKVVEVSCCEITKTSNPEDNCCSNNSEYLKLDVKSIIYNDYSINQIFGEDAHQLYSMDLHLNICALESSYAYQGFKEPPPITTPELLSQIQVYIL